jgi:hypothetical protein
MLPVTGVATRGQGTGKTILIEPADPIVSIGLNPLEGDRADFVQTAELAQILRDR